MCMGVFDERQDQESPADLGMPESCDAFLVDKKWLAYQRREVGRR